MLAKQKQGANQLPEQAGVAVLITEMDGSMLPVVETGRLGKRSIGE